MTKQLLQAITKAPFFVIGSPRSGTTLLRLILTSHSGLVVPPECGFIIWLQQSFGTWTNKEFSDAGAVSRFVDAVISARKFETWGLSREAVKTAITDRKPCTYSEACDSIYRCYCSHNGNDSTTWGDKNNYYLNHISSLARLFPNARFIHIVRDGRDIACSYRTIMATESNSPYRPVLPVNIDEIANKWSDDVHKSREQLARLDIRRVFELRYEDLVNKPEAIARRLCAGLGCIFEHRMLDFHIENKIRQLEPAATMDWKKRTLEPIDPSSIGRFHVELSKSEIAKFSDIARQELSYYQYID
jgi:predicted N-acyltransferase